MFFSKKIKIESSVLRVPRDMAWCFANGEYYEKNVLFWFGAIIDQLQNPVLYDIGANYGYFSVRFAGRSRSVYAFEPVSKTYRVLRENVEKNKLANVYPFNVGLSDNDSVISINLYSSSGNNSMYKRALPPNHPLKEVGQETIHVVKLDDFVAQKQLQPPDLVKIDIEGAELYALQGASRLLSESRPFIFMEYSDTTSNDAGYCKEALLQELHRYGYEIVGLSEDASNNNLIRESDFPETAIANIIAVPEGKSALLGTP